MKIGIAGFGCLGKAVEKTAFCADGAELAGVFTRRPPQTVRTGFDTTVFPFDEISLHRDEIDVMINCMGSANDLPVVTPYLAGLFNQVDSFDCHREMRAHFDRANAYAEKSGKLTLIGAGWDPGLFSLFRLYLGAAIPDASSHTFWGEGISRGHSNAVKQLDGVVDAAEYTLPVESAVSLARENNNISLTDRQMHRRVCFVVPEPGADCEYIAQQIKSMPNYFAGYDTKVHFVDYESFLCEHSGQSHAGTLIRNGEDAFAEFSLRLKSNPDFTAGILLSFAFAVHKMNKNGKKGAVTVFDIPPAELFSAQKERLFSFL